jgi:hypothetical protein
MISNEVDSDADNENAEDEEPEEVEDSFEVERGRTFFEMFSLINCT